MEFDNISHTYTNTSRTWEIVLGTVHIIFFPYEQTTLIAYPETKKKENKNNKSPMKNLKQKLKKKFLIFKAKSHFIPATDAFEFT